MKSSLLLLAYYYLPATTSGVQRALRFVKYLPRNGFPVFVVSSSESGSDLGCSNVSYVPDLASPRTRAAFHARVANLIQRWLLPYNEQLPWAPFAVEAGSRLIRKHGISAVISTSPPMGTHFAAWWLKRRYGLRWIADFRDPVLGNPGRPRRWALPYDRFVERMIFRSADAVLVVTDVIAEECRKRYPQWAGKIHVLWNGFDPEEVIEPREIPPRPYRCLSHVGILYAPRQPNSLLASLNRILQDGRIDANSIRLRFIGQVQDSGSLYSNPAVQSLLKSGCLEIYCESIPRREALTEIETSDYLLLLDIADLSQNGYAVPAKLHDYARTGRPILAVTPQESPVDRILEKSGLRYSCIYPGDTEETVDAKLLKFFSYPSDPASLSTWYTESFDGGKLAASVSRILDTLLDEDDR